MKPRPAGPDDWRSPEPTVNTEKKEQGLNKGLLIIGGIALLTNIGLIWFTFEQQRKFNIKIGALENKLKEPLTEKAAPENHSNNI